MSVSITEFGKTTAGVPIQRAVLKNDQIEVHLLTYAALIHKILVKDRKGVPVDVVLGLPCPGRLRTEHRQHGRSRRPFCQPHRRGAVPAV